jgi:PAS domain S-box-containing protein/putative nucleotidyltransferase with HDIG domain
MEKTGQTAIAERRRTNGGKKMRKDREKGLTAALEYIVEGVIATDRDGRVIFLNPSAQELTGWARTQAQGRAIDVVFRIDGNGKGTSGEHPVRSVLRQRTVVARDGDTVLISRAGKRQAVSIHVAPLIDGHRAITGAVLVFSPLAGRKGISGEISRKFKHLQCHQHAIVKLSTHPAVVSGDLHRATEQITEIVAEAMAVERVSIWLLDEDKEMLRCEDLFQRTSRRHTGGLILEAIRYPAYFRAMQSVRVVDAHDARRDPRTREFTEKYLIPNEIESMLDAAIRVSGELVGVVCHEQIKKRRYWSAEEIAFAGEVADQVAQAIQNSQRKRSQEALQKSLERVKNLFEQTVNVLASTVEMRDPYTAGHQRRVAVLACAIARETGLSEERIEGLRMAALIHDIGKIYVPAEILSKPGALTLTEQRLIQTHPQVGYDILKRVEFPWPVARIVLQHHERWDGSGFPKGISGEEILPEARILGVADVVEAMSSHRPYRAARGIPEALKIVSENAGILFDPEVVKACLSLFYRKGFQFK